MDSPGGVWVGSEHPTGGAGLGREQSEVPLSRGGAGQAPSAVISIYQHAPPRRWEVARGSVALGAGHGRWAHRLRDCHRRAARPMSAMQRRAARGPGPPPPPAWVRSLQLLLLVLAARGGCAAPAPRAEDLSLGVVSARPG